MTFSRIARAGVIALILLSVGCGGGGSGSTETAGTTLELSARVATPAQATFDTSEGVRIVLRNAYFTLWSVEVHSICTDPAFAFAPSQVLDWLVPAAQAHGESTPTKIGVPHVLNLLDANLATQPLWTLRPAVGTYCGLTIELIRADADALGLPKDVDMVDKLVHLAGTWQRGSAPAVPFEIVIRKSGASARLLLRPPVTLSRQNLRAQVGVAIDPSRWFNGLDFTQLDTTTQQDLLLANIRASMTTF